MRIWPSSLLTIPFENALVPKLPSSMNFKLCNTIASLRRPTLAASFITRCTSNGDLHIFARYVRGYPLGTNLVLTCVRRPRRCRFSRNAHSPHAIRHSRLSGEIGNCGSVSRRLASPSVGSLVWVAESGLHKSKKHIRSELRMCIGSD